MKHFKRLLNVLLVFTSLIMLCGCSPLQYKFFVRNTRLDNVHITLNAENKTNKLRVRYKNELIDINNKTLSQLNDSLTAISNDDKIVLDIPKNSTVFINDLLNTNYFFVTDKTLLIQSSNKTDSIKLNYPFRKNKALKRKKDAPYNLFYRTIIYYDITQ